MAGGIVIFSVAPLFTLIADGGGETLNRWEYQTRLVEFRLWAL